MIGIRKVTTHHHGRSIEWNESVIRISAIVDGLAVSIQKLHKSTFQKSRGGKLAKSDAPRYRVLVDNIFVQPGWGFRRDLKQAKDDGVALAIGTAAAVAESRKQTRKKSAATKT